jgi:hypothetical protein
MRAALVVLGSALLTVPGGAADAQAASVTTVAHSCIVTPQERDSFD